MEIVEIKQAEMLQAINRSEVDMQIATAKQYPRDVTQVLNRIETLATMDPETAADCFYILRRQGTMIEGLSVRMTEIIASQWGNMRVQTRIIGNDGKTITVQGVCHDLETNLAVSVEVKRRITTKEGKTYSEDMQVTTGNAAAAIAFRNSVLKVVPKAVTKKVIENVKRVAMGQELDMETSRQNLLKTIKRWGVSEQQLFEYLGIKKIEELDKEMIFEMRAVAQAIKEGTTTIEETFVKPQEDKKQADEAIKKAKEAKAKAQAAAQRQAKGKTQPATETPAEAKNEAERKEAQGPAEGLFNEQQVEEAQVEEDIPANVDPETGEIIE